MIEYKSFRIFLRPGHVIVYMTILAGLIYLIINGLLGDLILMLYSNTLLAYSVLFFTLSFAFLCIVLYRRRQYTPSMLLFIFFLAVPIFGYFSYVIFIDTHGTFFGKILSFDFPIFVWSVGMAAFFAGILLPHLFLRWPKRNLINVWNLGHISFILWFFLGISVIASIIAIVKIGYLPMLKSGINEVRGNYDSIAGRYPAKISRLFTITSPLAIILFFLKNKKIYLLVLLVSSLGSMMYGQRMYLVWAISFLCLIYFKFNKPKMRQIFMLGCVGICFVVLLILASEFRAGRLDENATLRENISFPLFSEYSYYALVTDEIRLSGEFLEEDIFLGTLVRILPRQIWALIGIDKEFVMAKYSAVHYFGEQFSDDMGTRITPIGEAYAGYGVIGVLVLMSIVGIVFGTLEKVYLNLNKLDVRLTVICFLLTLLISLPTATLSAIVDPFVFYGGILFICQLIGKRLAVDQVAVVETKHFGYSTTQNF